MAHRSSDPLDYHTVPRAVAAMAKPFPHGFHIARHQHYRDQLLWSVSGTKRVRTEAETWIVPPDRAVYLPSRTEHAINIRGEVGMRTLYIAPAADPRLPDRPVVAIIDALRDEVFYAAYRRGPGGMTQLAAPRIATPPRSWALSVAN